MSVVGKDEVEGPVLLARACHTHIIVCVCFFFFCSVEDKKQTDKRQFQRAGAPPVVGDRKQIWSVGDSGEVARG